MAIDFGAATTTVRPPVPKISPSGALANFNSDSSVPKNSAAFARASARLSPTNSLASWRVSYIDSFSLSFVQARFVRAASQLPQLDSVYSGQVAGCILFRIQY